MTFHFLDLEKQPGLDDAAAEDDLRKLTGCSIHKKINTICTEPGCPNNPQTSRPPVSPSASIFETHPKIRCIL